jgi:hypothetical protein
MLGIWTLKRASLASGGNTSEVLVYLQWCWRCSWNFCFKVWIFFILSVILYTQASVLPFGVSRFISDSNKDLKSDDFLVAFEDNTVLEDYVRHQRNHPAAHKSSDNHPIYLLQPDFGPLKISPSQTSLHFFSKERKNGSFSSLPRKCFGGSLSCGLRRRNFITTRGSHINHNERCIFQ